MSGALLRRNRGYRLLFSASALSNLGDGISALAFPWLATMLTRDPLLIGAVAAAARLPWLLFSVPAGVVVDRADRRRLIARADLLRAGLTVGVIALIASAGPPLPDGSAAAPVTALALASLAFLLGTVEVVRDNAAQTVLPSLVAPGDLERANGQMWSAERVLNAFVGPPLAGFLIAWAVPLPFAVDALTFAVAAWLVWLIALPPKPAVVHAPFLHELREGWRWLRGHPLLLRLAVALGALNFCSTVSLTLLVLVAREVMGLGAPGYGLVLSAAAAGGVAGALGGPWVAGRIGGTASVILGVSAMAAGHLALWAAPSAAFLAAALALEAAGGMLWNIVTVSYRQRRIPTAILGRVNALYRFFGWGAIPLGALAAGAAVAALEPALGREAALRAPYLATAMAVGAVALYVAARVRLPRAGAP